MRSVTQKDIALQLGLSQRAISLALQRSPRVSSQTIERVWKHARKLGYRPNTAAKTVRSGRFHNITVVLSSVESRSRFTIPFLNHLLAALDARGVHLSIARVGDEKLSGPASLPKLLHEQSADGLIINYLEHVPETVKQLVTQSTVPTVWVGAKLAHDCVYPDTLEEGRMAARHLLELGHRKIVYFDPLMASRGPDAHFSSLERAEGYRQILSERRLRLDFWHPSTVFASDLAAAKSLFDRPRLPTAVICAWQTHLPALLYAAGLKGCRIPEDLSVLVFADPGVDAPMAMTQVQMDFKLRAEAAVSLLMDRIDGRIASPAAPFLVPPLFVRGVSTACLTS